MKNLFLSILTLLCVFNYTTTSAQIDITANPIGLLFGDLSFGADFAVSEKFSVEAMVGIGGNKDDNFKFTQIPINVVGKFYLNPDNGSDKFYVSSFLRFVNRNYAYSDLINTNGVNRDYKATRLGLGFGLGYKIATEKGFIFDIGLGLGRALFTKTNYAQADTALLNLDFEKWIPVVGFGKLAIGYRFGGGKK
jgi:hypothetical protein